MEPFNPYYDKNGEPLNVVEWGGKFNDLNYKLIRQDTIGKYFISTVWLGIDHNFVSAKHEPVIFETMVFCNREDLEQIRYSRECEALRGHRMMVAKYSRKVKKNVQV